MNNEELEAPAAAAGTSTEAAGAQQAPQPQQYLQQPPVYTLKHETPELTAVSIKNRVPEFWQEMPSLWFHQFEIIISAQKASDQLKYELLVARLGRDELRHINDILQAPPTTHKYEAIKSRLLHTFQQSAEKKLHQLLEEMVLGDQKPSLFYRRMQELAGDQLPKDTLRILWIKRLPPTVRAVLTGSGIQDIDKLADIADKIMETTSMGEIAEVNHAPPAQSTSFASTADLERKLNFVIEELQLLKTQQNNSWHNQNYRRDRSRSRSSRPTSRSQSPRKPYVDFDDQSARPGDSNYLCYYHYVFGEKARKCAEPCSYKSQGN